MGKMAYVLEGDLFNRVDFKHAEELLAEYNDFYIFNMAQYANTSKFPDFIFGDADEEDEDTERKEREAKSATEQFMALFGSKDFGESSMVGFRPAWYDLQKVLLDEQKHKTDIRDSAMNKIAPTLRNIASTLLFAERIISGMDKCDAADDQVNTVKAGFKTLLVRASAGEVNLPEYAKCKKELSKLKKSEQYIEFAHNLFGTR